MEEEEEERSKRTRIPFEQLTGLVRSLSPRSRIYRLRAGRPSLLERAQRRRDATGERAGERERVRSGERVASALERRRRPSPRGLKRLSRASANREAPPGLTGESAGDADITRLLSGGKKK